jgi:hypothetical protein
LEGEIRRGRVSDKRTRASEPKDRGKGEHNDREKVVKQREHEREDRTVVWELYVRSIYSTRLVFVCDVAYFTGSTASVTNNMGFMFHFMYPELRILAAVSGRRYGEDKKIFTERGILCLRLGLLMAEKENSLSLSHHLLPLLRGFPAL